MTHRQRGAALAIGLWLLTLVTLLGLAAAGSAHVERLLAQNEGFRENAASAATAGIELAIRAIVTSPDPTAIPAHLSGTLPDSADRYDVTLRLVGYATSLPQEPGAQLAGATFEILSSGFAARRAVDRQRAGVLWTVDGPAGMPAADCIPLAPRACHHRGDLERLSWQRVPE
jgi:Tfp pilus assembly protein PilX